MNKVEHVTKVERGSISYGVLNMMNYYSANDIEYPDWLVSRFDKLPRTNNDLIKFCVKLPWIKKGVNNLSYIHGEITVWIIENLEHGWYKGNNNFYFEDELDAMTFKLRWV